MVHIEWHISRRKVTCEWLYREIMSHSCHKSFIVSSATTPPTDECRPAQESVGEPRRVKASPGECRRAHTSPYEYRRAQVNIDEPKRTLTSTYESRRAH